MQADYVNVLALTERDEVVLVEQFRPALQRPSLELPGGLRELGEDPIATARRELREETGYVPRDDVELLGRLDPDPGRLENAMWGFIAKPVVPCRDAWRPEPDVRRVLLDIGEFERRVAGADFTHGPHIAILALAYLRGAIRPPSPTS